MNLKIRENRGPPERPLFRNCIDISAGTLSWNQALNINTMICINIEFKITIHLVISQNVIKLSKIILTFG